MVRNPSRTWALLVGVDKYSDTGANALYGCVRDAENMYDVIVTDLRVPPSNITMLTSPHDDKVNDNPHRSGRLPTRANMLAEFNKISQLEKKPGDVFIFCFSGHGTRTDTAHKNLKGASAKDEAICLPNDEYIWDVELGTTLNDLSKQGLAVVVVLDCCHSGTMDRDKEGWVIRSLGEVSAESQAQSGDGGDAAGTVDNSADTISTRNAVFGHEKSYLYKDRGYNLIAGCQPHETSAEVKLPAPGGSLLKQGALTYCLIKSLQSLKDSIGVVTYGALFDVMDAHLKSTFPQEPRQHPRQWGDTSRFVFSADRQNDASNKLHATVIKKTDDLVTLDKGSSADISYGDQFRLYQPSKFVTIMAAPTSNQATNVTLDVMVTTVRDSQADVVPVSANQAVALKGVDIGWIGQLLKKASQTTVRVVLPDNMQAAAKARLQQGWAALVDPCMPVNLRFEKQPVTGEAFSVDVNQGIFRVFDDKGQQLPFLPRVVADGPSNVGQLMGLLHHLGSYRAVAKIPSSQKPAGSPPFTFTAVSHPYDHGKPRSLGAVEVYFENKSTEALYITILDLSPAYGVAEIFPGPFNQSEVVEANTVIKDNEGKPGIVIELEPPDILLPKVPKTFYLNQPPTAELKAGNGDPNFKMTDVLKVFVTKTPETYAHYVVPDMEEDPAKLEARLQKLIGALRGTPHVTPRPTWSVEEIKVTSPSKP